MPSFTVHDISHLDALWELADTILPADEYLTPVEAFAFGGSVLLHDLGMGLVAYRDGITAITSTREWRETLAVTINVERGKWPTEEELNDPPVGVYEESLTTTLRRHHAAQAYNLVNQSWTTAAGNAIYLIDDVELRESFGHLIGQLAYSHWWDVSRLPKEFQSPVGSLVEFPAAWTVNRLRLACLLRLADAAHLDRRRAPTFLRALRRPTGTSAKHWGFQEKLNRPRLVNGRLVYSSVRSFTATEAQEWWLALDSLRMVDEEIRKVNGLLYDLREPALAVVGVAGVDNPSRLERYLGADGWTPVDVKLTVDEPGRLAATLGGWELYGEHPEFALRELLQNATDAIRLRRTLDPEFDGRIVVSLIQESSGYVLEVSDDGVGMNDVVLSEVLLDFGATLWRSSYGQTLFPGALSAGYRPTGKYGIGFYSVFMLGESVSVTTNRFDEASAATSVLTFDDGLSERPVLRRARAEERIRGCGTRVRIQLSTSPTSRNRDHLGRRPAGLFYGSHTDTLERLCIELAPALEVDIFCVADGIRSQVLSGGDWRTLSALELLMRISIAAWEVEAVDRSNMELVGSYLSEIHHDGRIVGRAALDGSYAAVGLSTIGGLRCEYIFGIAGLVEVESTRADRAKGRPVATDDDLRHWFLRQLDLLYTRSDLTGVQLWQLSSCVRARGIETPRLPVALLRSKLLTDEGFIGWAAGQNEVWMVDWPVGCQFHQLDWDVVSVSRATGRNVTWNENIVVHYAHKDIFDWDYEESRRDASYYPKDLSDFVVSDLTERWRREWWFRSGNERGQLITLLAKAWRTSTDQLMSKVNWPEPRLSKETQVGSDDSGIPLRYPADRFVRP